MPKKKKLTEAERTAAAARLVYMSGNEPGITRRKYRQGFRYYDPNGQPIRDPDETARINAIAIPPAWTEVWISPNPDGHILAVGRDQKGRKQYRYHPRWSEVRSETNFSRMLAFAECLPAIRAATDQHLRLTKLPREKVLAVVVRLLETTLIRIGNAEYARHNDSYGLTTMQDEHVAVQGKKIQFEFRGKSGKEHLIDVEDARLARVVKACRDIPGYALFQYYDDEGIQRKIGSADVNAYLLELTGQHFTAKDFRTWGGSTLAVAALRRLEPAESETEAKRCISAAIQEVAQSLGNTTAVCRRHYVHPLVLDAFCEGLLPTIWAGQQADSNPFGLTQDEQTLVALLRRA